MSEPNDHNLNPCIDWVENLPKINAQIELQFIRSGVQYDGLPFRYCPWCGQRNRVLVFEEKKYEL